MTENTNTQPTEQKVKKSKYKLTARDKAARTLFPTQEAANDAKPDGKHLHPFTVTSPVDDKTYWTWAMDNFGALVNAARFFGFTASAIGKVVSKDRVGGLLAALSPEDRDALLAQYQAPKGKGKK